MEKTKPETLVFKGVIYIPHYQAHGTVDLTVTVTPTEDEEVMNTRVACWVDFVIPDEVYTEGCEVGLADKINDLILNNTIGTSGELEEIAIIFGKKALYKAADFSGGYDVEVTFSHCERGMNYMN